MVPPRPRVLFVLFLAVALLPCADYARWIWQRFPSEIFTPSNALVVRDYVNIWVSGQLVGAGRTDTVFDPDAYQAWLQGVFGPAFDLHTWSYPPHLLLLTVPFGLLPILPGFAVWTVATLAFLGVVLRGAGMALPAICAVLLSPAAAENALAGQNRALTAAALAGGLLLAGQRPVAAGALLALLTTKPQMGLLVPVCLLVSRDRRTSAWAAGFSLLYVSASLPFFGVDAWERYAAATSQFMRSVVMEAPFGLAFQLQMPTPFISARAAGAGLSTAYAAQAAATLLCVVLTALAWSPRRPAGARPAAVALTLLLAPLATPYSHSYDLLCAAVALALLVRGTAAGTLPRPEFYAFAAAWIWPGVAFKVGMAVCPGLGPLFLGPAAVCAAVRSLRRLPPPRTTHSGPPHALAAPSVAR